MRNTALNTSTRPTDTAERDLEHKLAIGLGKALKAALREFNKK